MYFPCFQQPAFMFRERPLTWLFVIATVLSDLVLVCWPARNPSEFWLSLGYLLGQGTVLGAWFALGNSERLVRGVFFVGGVLGLTVAAYSHRFAGAPDDFWGRLVAVLSLYGGVAFAVALLGMLTSAVRQKANANKLGALRFPLIELFGWTIIFALASLVIKAIDFSELLRRDGLLAFHLGSAVVAGSLAWLFLTPKGSLSLKFAIAAFLEFTFYWFLPSLSRSNSTAISVLFITHAYVALWLLVQLLDQAQRQSILKSELADEADTNPTSADSFPGE